MREYCPHFAIIHTQTGLERRDCPVSDAVLSRLFSGRHMRSPVSSKALGECNAITSQGFGPGLTTIQQLREHPGLFRSDNIRTKTCSRSPLGSLGNELYAAIQDRPKAVEPVFAAFRTFDRGSAITFLKPFSSHVFWLSADSKKPKTG
jgi:hypothetical protein